MESQLTGDHDQRLSPFACGPGKLDSSSIYRLLKAKGQPADPCSQFIWRYSTPPRVQLFMWLLTKGRIQCRANLFKKRIIDTPSCEVCGASEETADHILFQCPFAVAFWNKLGLPLLDGISASIIHTIQNVQRVPEKQYSMFVALCCWQLWKRRNAVIFRGEHSSLRHLLILCALEARIWRARMPKKQKQVSENWCSLFDDLIESEM